MQLTSAEYDSIVLKPKYDLIKSKDAQLSDKIVPIVEDEGETFEVLVISDDFQSKTEIENEIEEFELLEIDEQNEIQESTSENIQKENHETTVEQIQNTDSFDSNEIQNKITSKIIQTRSDRKLRSNVRNNFENVRKSVRQAAKTKLDLKSSESNQKRCKQTPITVKKEKNTNKNVKESCEMDSMQQDFDDIEGESDDEFPARDSDNEDWPSQETLSEFPKQMIKNGLLQVKGKDLMSLICRYLIISIRLIPS